MILPAAKLFLGFFILFALVGIGVFGLLQFNHAVHSAEAPIANCPYTGSGYSICQNTLNHINNWRQFFNVIFFAFSIFSFLILGIILYFLGRNFLHRREYFYSWKYYLYHQKLYNSPDRIIKWLSLFENIPSFARARQS